MQDTDGWRFHDDARSFLAVAEDLVAADPVRYSIMNGWAGREVRRIDAGDWVRPEGAYWYASHLVAGRVDAVAMRTAPFAPRPLWLPSMGPETAEALAYALLARGEVVTWEEFGVNGADPGATALCRRVARVQGRRVEVAERQRLFRCDRVRIPPAPAGTLRRARTEETALVVQRTDAFLADADDQAGRTPRHGPGDRLADGEIARRVAEGAYWVFEDRCGEVVHMTALAPLTHGAAGIGPVHTPAEYRGRGYAGYTVATLTAQVLAAGGTPYLFTDQSNPVSNRLYTSMGYTPVEDHLQVRVR